jgi:transcriptional regulator with XRE-family HTH domain
MVRRQATQETLAFGAELARLRELTGMTRLEMARAASVTRSYIGQVETGVTRCRYDFAQRADAALGTVTALADTWDELLRGTGYPRYFTDFAKGEGAAVFLRAYENTLVYGLLQSEAYAQVLVVSDSAVATRMKRQALLTRDHPPTLCVVMDESVLYRQVGDRTVMGEQLEYLITVSELSNITLQIAPTGYYREVRGAFAIATQADGSDVAYLAHLTGGITTTESGDIVHAEKSFALLQARALAPDASRDLIRKVVDERWTT